MLKPLFFISITKGKIGMYTQEQAEEMLSRYYEHYDPMLVKVIYTAPIKIRSARPFFAKHKGFSSKRWSTPAEVLNEVIENVGIPYRRFETEEDREDYIYDLFEDYLEAGDLYKAYKIISVNYPDRERHIQRFLSREQMRLSKIANQKVGVENHD